MHGHRQPEVDEARHTESLIRDWRLPPRAFPVGYRDWGVPAEYKGYDWNEVERVGDRLYWKHWDGLRFELEPNNVILLNRTPGGRYERMTGTVNIHGVEFPLKPREGPAFDFRPHTLYPAMFPNGLQPESRRRVSVGQPR